MAGVAKPRAPESRSRRPSKSEIEALAICADADLTNATARAFHAFLFAIETGMRAGEIIGLTKDRIDTTKRVARLDMTKSGPARDVPLSTEAVRLLKALPKADPVFGLDFRQLDALWRKVRDRADAS